MLTQREARAGLGPILADGTTVGELVDIDRREVSARVIHDRELYELELRNIFAKAWIAVGHESEIPRPGDYVTRYVGEDNVIVSRADDGSVHVSLNVCVHRGMQVCRSEMGHTERFKCPYHGFSFGKDGRLLGAPFERARYGDILRGSNLSLRQARVELFGGLVFCTWDERAPELREFLGDIAWYLEALLCGTDAGFEVLGPPQRVVIEANWKTAAEQLHTDGYHVATLHRTLADLGIVAQKRDAESWSLYAVDLSTEIGHAFRCFDATKVWSAYEGANEGALTAMDKLRRMPPMGIPAELVPQLEKNLSPGQLQLLADTPPTVGEVWPNLGVLWFPGAYEIGKVGPMAGFHTLVPKGPDRMEFWTWLIAAKDASPEYKELLTRSAMRNLGPGGVVEADDAEAWPAQQHSARGVIGRQETWKYQTFLGENRPADWAGPGLVYEGMTKDDAQWQFWLRWHDFMTEQAW
ncbi:aromatic ring-hydroxylating oxygenase subunit alpha [Streptomyces ipomoeae]|uniref:aromatic ring-hydroxylating oxygenase subunit alpha n=1 Tax=Streptomyces ipomoeae TaxID=103232 RepID=UPI00114643CF|nr:Rieske 2Fe-2S domain-containing protein [Streptomyces ipomoeae]MDX2937787.1 Rieske 2Fe-2S domain-containing protein [Streptomyces ipomoeae]TQE17208.1 aromatic ring-hydroxylating dioxygenase subunit alpha [Streptomyces ipomoeae]